MVKARKNDILIWHREAQAKHNRTEITKSMKRTMQQSLLNIWDKQSKKGMDQGKFVLVQLQERTRTVLPSGHFIDLLLFK